VRFWTSDNVEGASDDSGQARNEELARAAEEQLEGNNSASTSGSTGSGGNGGLSSAMRTNSADVVAYIEDYDTSIPNLNNVCTRCHSNI
jgi:CCR4-NOT transcription complex subunit 10